MNAIARVIFDKVFFARVGLADIGGPALETLSSILHAQLGVKVGTRIADQMSDEEFEEFESLIDEEDEDRARIWLETHRPDYSEVVAREITSLMRAVRRNRDAIRAVLGSKEPTTYDSTLNTK